jgi:hypothetical protein
MYENWLPGSFSLTNRFKGKKVFGQILTVFNTTINLIVDKRKRAQIFMFNIGPKSYRPKCKLMKRFQVDYMSDESSESDEEVLESANIKGVDQVSSFFWGGGVSNPLCVSSSTLLHFSDLFVSTTPVNWDDRQRLAHAWEHGSDEFFNRERNVTLFCQEVNVQITAIFTNFSEKNTW